MFVFSVAGDRCIHLRQRQCRTSFRSRLCGCRCHSETFNFHWNMREHVCSDERIFNDPVSFEHSNINSFLKLACSAMQKMKTLKKSIFKYCPRQFKLYILFNNSFGTVLKYRKIHPVFFSSGFTINFFINCYCMKRTKKDYASIYSVRLHRHLTLELIAEIMFARILDIMPL